MAELPDLQPKRAPTPMPSWKRAAGYALVSLTAEIGPLAQEFPRGRDHAQADSRPVLLDLPGDMLGSRA